MTENHGVPGSNPGPATPKTVDSQVKPPITLTEASSPTSMPTTTSFVGVPEPAASRAALGSSVAAVEAVSDDIWRHEHGPSKTESSLFKRISGTTR
jgi:hypothetical protein